MRLSDLPNFQFLEEAEDDDNVTLSTIKAQTGTNELIDRFLSDYGVGECPPIDELVVILTVKDSYVEYQPSSISSEMVYAVDTSSWSLQMEQGDFGNTMLIASFSSIELGKLQDKFLAEIGDDNDVVEGDIEFDFVLCSDVNSDFSEQDLIEMQLSFSKYIPVMTFQEIVVAYMTSEQFLQISNGLPVVDDREV